MVCKMQIFNCMGELSDIKKSPGGAFFFHLDFLADSMGKAFYDFRMQTYTKINKNKQYSH